MGKINSKSKYNYRFPTMSHSPSPSLLLTSSDRKKVAIDICDFHNQPRLCMKKKVLILGLDGVGKTDLFTRLICHERPSIKINPLPRPTIGYNVETIKLHCHHICHRRSHKITLWDCGGQSSVRSLWPYHFSNTSLLLWLINVHDRSRLDTNLQLLSHILTNQLLYRIPVLIVLYDSLFDFEDEKIVPDEEKDQNLLTNLEVAFRFLATLSTSRASTFKWQVIHIHSNGNNDDDIKKLRQSFKELMDL